MLRITLCISALILCASAVRSCSPGSSCFPDLSALAAFNVSIDGKLHSERPVAAPCYPSDPLYSPSICSVVTENYGNNQWRSDRFSAYQQINWEVCGVKDGCLLPTTSNISVCGQGSVPTYSVHATTASDVQKYVQFATKHNLDIVIKNTGHDYKGRSSGIDGFALWTHGIQGITRNQSFVPKGCTVTPQDSISVGSGVQWLTAYEFADAQDVLIVGGDCDQVGAGGGWILGGGHSILSPTYGLGVDNLLEVEIVTPDGQLQIISECSNSDLFWAIRGGGGGTWGVLTQATYKAHKSVPINAVFVSSNSSTPDKNAQVVGNFSALYPHLKDFGIGGFMAVYPSQLTYIGVLPGGNLSKLQAAIKPFADTLPAGSVTYTTYPSYLQFSAATLGGPDAEIVGIPLAVGSRLIPRHYFENDPQGLARAIRKGQTALGSQADSQFIQILMDSPPSSLNLGKTSVTPVWYNSLWHVVYTSTWNTTTSVTGQRAVVKSVHDAANALRAYAPDGGAYSNEADVYEPDYLESFWGTANAARLQKIKKQVDPRNFFQVWQGIGWGGAGDRKYECYAELNPGGIQLD